MDNVNTPYNKRKAKVKRVLILVLMDNVNTINQIFRQNN